MARFASLLALFTSIALSETNAATYTVRIRNLTYLQPFSPPLVVAHTRDISIFQEGAQSSAALQLMAEDGDNSGLIALGEDETVAPFVCGAVVSDIPLFPGETWRGDMEVDLDVCGDNPVFSLVAMLINTNDAFVGIDSEALVTSGASKSFPPAYDAGTEANNELCDFIPGPGCEDPTNLAAGDGEDFIHIHRGLHGIGNLSESSYDWRNPVAEVVMFAP